MLRVPADVIIQLQAPDCWVIYNVFSRTCLGADHSVLELLGEIGTLDYPELAAKYKGPFRVWEINYFSNYEGLLADPTRLLRDVAAWPPAEDLDLDNVISRLKQRFLVIDDENSYRERFAPKTLLVDTDHFGNFHQQLGQELMVVHRELARDWWLRQKFSEDLSEVRDNLYGAVQASYLESYFGRRFRPGSSVVDLGCGIGFYSNMMAQAGATVLGVDPDEKYIDIARQRAVTGTRFEVLDVGQEGALDTIPAASADFVFMSDALLFYFVPERPTQVADIKVLLADVRRILKPSGIFISVEPHYIFWLLPWLGEVAHPFTVLTEYKNKTFGVTPTISALVQAFTAGGFAVIWMDEIGPKDAFKNTDPRAYHFAKEFPVWQIFELKPFQ
jgi:SAM-dependent methyltransferase